MGKRFIDGLAFGAGFGVAFVVIWYFAAYFIYPRIAEPYTEILSGTEYSNPTTYSRSVPAETLEPAVSRDEVRVPFHELTLEQQIELSSVIALAEYTQSEDGQMKAIITEFLKKDPGTVIYYSVGDEHSISSYYPKEGSNHGDGIVIFFVGSPAPMQMSMTYSGDRIRGLGDMPLKLLKQKCDDNNA